MRNVEMPLVVDTKRAGTFETDILDAKGFLVAQVYNRYTDNTAPNSCAERCEDIVRAVNAHAELVAAVRDAARWINTLPAEIRDGSIMPEKLAAVLQDVGESA